MKHTSAIVVGGGITGLACAHALARRSVDLLLIEKQERLGGTIQTERIGDFLLDTGPDAFLTQKPQALSLCRDIGLESRLIPTNPEKRIVYVLRQGKLHSLPEGMVLTVPTRVLPFALSSLFSPWGKMRMGLEVFVPPRREVEEESIASFIERRLGREALERLAEPLLAGIHSGDPDRLSMDHLFPRFVALEQKHGSLIRGMRKARPRGNSGPPASLFMSLAGGLSELVETLAAQLPSGSVLKGKGARRVWREGTRYSVETSRGEVFTSDALVLSMPLRATERVADGLSSELSRALSGHKAVSTTVVFLAFRREEVRHPLNGYGFVVPATEGRRILAATFVSTKFPNRSPRSHVLLRAFWGGARDPQAARLPDRELTELARREFSEILGELPQPVMERVYRWMDSTPQLEVGHRHKLAALDEILARFPGLEMAGNGLRGVGIPDCIADGHRAAEAVAGYLEGKKAT